MHTLIYVSQCKPQCEALLMYPEHSDSAITKIHCNIVAYVGEVQQAVAVTGQTVKSVKSQCIHSCIFILLLHSVVNRQKKCNCTVVSV